MSKKISNNIKKITSEIINKFIEENTVKEENKWRGYNDYASYQSEDEDELMEYSLLKPKFSGLNIDLYIDDGGAYIRHEHPLWLYFRNGYAKNDGVLPISISNTPKVLLNNYELGISRTDFESVILFVKLNVDLLVAFANDELSHNDFFKNIKTPSFSLVENKIVLQEMATIKSRDSGLPVDIWVDEDRQFEGHAPRIKFKASREQRTTREFSTMTITNDPQVINLPQRVDIDNRSIEMVKRFVLYNKDLLLALINGQIDYHTDFLSKMIRIDNNGEPIYPQITNELNYEAIMKCNNGFIMIKSQNGMFNFLNTNNQIISPKQWFTNAQPFVNNQNGTYAMVQIDEMWYWLLENGELRLMN